MFEVVFQFVQSRGKEIRIFFWRKIRIMRQIDYETNLSVEIKEEINSVYNNLVIKCCFLI